MYILFCRPLTYKQKRESNVTTTTLLDPGNYTFRGSNGALHMQSMPRAASPLMVNYFNFVKEILANRFLFSFQSGLDENSV